MITKYIVGDITQTELKYIAHGVNCMNKMGSGVARALYEKFPEVKTQYHNYMNENGWDTYLGSTQMVKSGDKYIFNCWTQNLYGYDNKRYVNYAALSKCFHELAGTITGHKLAIPKIGCGLAGGDWKFVEQLIDDTVGDDLEIWVYELETPVSSGKNDLG